MWVMNIRKWMTLFVGLLFMLTFGLTACGSSDAPKGMREVTLMLDWTPNTNHAGIYLAKHKGWFEEEGINLTIIEPAQVGVEAAVGAGAAHFGFSYSEYLLPARNAGVTALSVAAVLPHNDSSLMLLGSSGVTRPRELEGKLYGGWGGVLETHLVKTLVTCDGGDASTLEFVEVGNVPAVESMEAGRFDFVWEFEGWGVIRSRELLGRDVTTLRFIDYLNCIPDWYTPILITGEALAMDNPELVKDFLKVASKGYNEAMKSPSDSAEALLALAPELDSTLVKLAADYHADKYRDGDTAWGIQDETVWQGFTQFLLEAEYLEQAPDLASTWTNEFLPD
jgi:ABC-type nitrate/sulfonate/bicarbonate transport system substrate-binding protein